MADVPYGLWLRYIKGIWSNFSCSPRTVLDLACGTGNFSLLLARDGYEVVGVDASPSMLEVARRKFAVEGVKSEFRLGDMKDFQLDVPVDAAICVFDSLNYLLEPQHVQSAFRSVAAALNPGGLFVFDVNTPLRLATIPQETTLYEGPGYVVVWRDLWDAARRWWQVNLTGFMEEGGVWHRFDEIHRERAFPLEDLSAWLQEAGFQVKGIFDSYSFTPASNVTNRAYFAARKSSAETGV